MIFSTNSGTVIISIYSLFNKLINKSIQFFINSNQTFLIGVEWRVDWCWCLLVAEEKKWNCGLWLVGQPSAAIEFHSAALPPSSISSILAPALSYSLRSFSPPLTSLCLFINWIELGERRQANEWRKRMNDWVGAGSKTYNQPPRQLNEWNSFIKAGGPTIHSFIHSFIQENKFDLFSFIPQSMNSWIDEGERKYIITVIVNVTSSATNSRLLTMS